MNVLYATIMFSYCIFSLFIRNVAFNSDIWWTDVLEKCTINKGKNLENVAPQKHQLEQIDF